MTLKKKPFILPVAVLLLFPLACNALSSGRPILGSGNLATEVRSVSGFESVAVGDGMHLLLVQGEPGSEISLEIEAQENLLPYIESTVSGGRLSVGFDRLDNLRINATRPITVRLTMPVVQSVDISGGGRLESAALSSEDLTLEASGGGRLKVDDLQAGSVSVNLSGGSGAELAGAVDTLNLKMSGGGQLDAADLQSRSASAEISGGGTATLWVHEMLQAGLSGGSHIRYYGSARTEENVSGGSAVTSLGDR